MPESQSEERLCARQLPQASRLFSPQNGEFEERDFHCCWPFAATVLLGFFSTPECWRARQADAQMTSPVRPHPDATCLLSSF